VSVAETEPAGPAASVTPARPPKSVTHYGLNTIALIIVLGTMYVLRTHPKLAKDPVMALCAAVAVPVLLLDVLVLKVHRRATTGLDWEREFAPSLERVVLKVAGLVMTLAPFALAYWVFPEYNASFYTPFYNLLARFWPGLVASSVLYITIVDGHMIRPQDTYWQLGRLLLGKSGDLRPAEIKNHYLGWLVKAFFFPLMFVWLNNSTNNVVHYDLTTASWSNLRAYDFLYDFIFFIDLLFTTVGYALCFRPIDSHIRTAEPTFLGWGVALFCYEPFFGMLFEKQYVHYQGLGFGNWLAPMQTVRWAWAITILLLITIYVLATVAFGIRFSNLTHRGILTNGPYRFTKHPAYVSKNLSWWLLSVPFIPNESAAISIKHCVGLLVVNYMYFMRAKTEERHLSRDPTYVAYALWMNEHGWLRLLNRIPLAKHIFIYKPPANAPSIVDLPDPTALTVTTPVTAPSAG
jgi:protein-S-isoprenylcysteine O-methyltransferase Ste14